MAKLPHQSTVDPVDPQDGATKADGGAADSLQTTTTDVVVSSAAAPSTGDVLTAIDGVSADWQAPAAGGGSTAGVSFNSQSAEFELSSTQYANAGDVTFLDGLTELTVEMWVNPESLPSNGGFCGKAKQGTSDTFSWKLENGGFRLYLSTDGGFGTQTVFNSLAMTLNAWTHVAFTWDGASGDTKAYKNGVQHDITKAGLVGALFNGTAPFLIGKRDDNFSHQWDGGMSELRVWGKVRTAAEIANNRFSAMSGGETDLLALYHLDGDFTEVVAGADASGVNAPTFTNEVPFNSDANAIHTNVAGEIDALTLKATPVAADLLAIEDSAASFAKKKITLTDLLGGGSAGPVAAAQGDYMMATITGNIAVPSNDTPYLFDSAVQSKGLTLSSGRVSGLKAGRTYWISGTVRGNNVTGEFLRNQVYDVTGASYLGLESLQQEDNRSVDAMEVNQAVAMFAPLVDSEIELHPRAGGGTGLTNDSLSQLQVIEQGAVQADVVGGLEFMDIINVSVATPVISFGATGDGEFQRAMDGNVDDTYVVDFGLVLSGSNDVSIRPNGVTANQEGRRYTGGSSLGSDVAYMIISDPTGVNDKEEGSLELRAAVTRGGVAQSRTYRSTSTTYDSSGLSSLPRGAAGRWDNTVDNIVSLDLAVETSGNFEPGTYAILWRKTQTNLRADSAAVYERMSMETVDPGALVTTERTVGHAIYGGSIVGVSARVEDAVTAGSITVNIKAGGVTKLTAVLDTTNSTSRVVRAAIGQQTFAADENISVEFVPSAYDNAGSIASAVTVQVHMTNDALITQNDRVVARDELGANATTITLSGLNGDLDEEYEVVGRLDLTTTAHSLDMQINGTSVNLSTGRVNNGGGIINDTAGLFLGSGAVSSENELSFRMRFFVKRGNMRRGWEASTVHTFSAGTIHVNNHTGVLLDETANITSIGFNSTVASGILAGSWVEVRRVKA
jgi:hypothetical protein